MPLNLTPHAWISLAVTLAVFVALQFRRGIPTDLLFLGGLVAVTIAGVITPGEALAGFANPAVITVGALLVVAAGLRATGVLDWVGHQLLGTAKTAESALGRLAVMLVSISAFIINTAVVAMFVPVVLEWCRRRGVSPSRLLIPVSYLAILGGTCTLIGTSTNIIVNGLLKDEQAQEQQRIAQNPEGQGKYSPAFAEELRPMSLFEIGRVGLPAAVVGALYLLLFGRRVLPNRTELVDQLDEQRREYLVEMLVKPDCRMVGQTVEQAGLPQLRGLYLLEIDRDDELLTPVTPNDVIHAGDRLVFTGVVTTIVDLEKIPGLVPAADMTYELHPTRRQQRQLSEAVISTSSPLIGTTIRRANFRRQYSAAVVAVHRNGARLRGKIGDIELQPGDTLLLQTRAGFAQQFRHSRDFYLVAEVEGSAPRRTHRAWLAVAAMAGLIVWLAATSWFGKSNELAGLGSPAIAALTIAGLMVVGRCLPMAEARSAIDLHILVTVAAALGIGHALATSGAAEGVAFLLVKALGRISNGNPFVLLAVLYVLTVIFTETISNNAVAVMLFPLGVAMANASGYSPRPFVMAIAVAASLTFLTPIGYQANLMVMGPGGYQPRDYLRAGWPLALLVMLTSMLLIPLIWPFALSSP